MINGKKEDHTIASPFDGHVQDGYIYITKTMEWDMGHRLMHHDGKCHNLHGHRYQIELGITGPLDEGTGMIVDYAQIKAFLKDIIEPWDHKMMLNEKDPIMAIRGLDGAYGIITVPWEPTAENISRYVLQKALDHWARHSLKPRGVTLWETPTSKAVARVK
jgi:6-pyruvoyltetrahydropterin/6-carboxytetrahydropterin synthase